MHLFNFTNWSRYQQLYIFSLKIALLVLIYVNAKLFSLNCIIFRLCRILYRVNFFEVNKILMCVERELSDGPFFGGTIFMFYSAGSKAILN